VGGNVIRSQRSPGASRQIFQTPNPESSNHKIQNRECGKNERPMIMKTLNLIHPLRVVLHRLALAGAASLALIALPAPAAPVSGILNGSFEETTTPDNWVAAASWTGLPDALSLITGTESIPATDGTRFLRLQTEDSGYTARVAQYLGTMVAGQTYTFRADVIASNAYGDYGATAAFVKEGVEIPSTVYATQTVNVAQGATGGFILFYTAQSADTGQDLYIWLQAEPVKGANIYTRGGIDRARLEGPSLFTENFDSYTSPNSGGQYETDLPVAWGGAVTGWSSGGSGGVIHAVQLNASPNWAPMLYDADHLTLATGIAANATGISYGVAFKYGPANYGTAGQQTTAADYLLVEVLRADDTVLASGKYYPKDWSNPANVNLSAGKRGLLPYVGDGSGNVRLRISGPLNARFNGEIDDLEVLQDPIVPPAVPDEPSSPSPANGAGIAGVSTTLTWMSDPLATSYQVFLWPVGDAKPATATATVTDPTYSPGTLLAGTTYQWQVVAVNDVGTTPGPVWTFTTGVIPFTYVYEPDSAPPNVPAELAAPYMLNDGLIGTGWDAMTQLYSLPPYVYPVPKIPYITLTLDSNPGLQKLTVWYTRAIEAGIAEPLSVTVSDAFGHSSTTTFTPQSSNGVFSQDVALPGMQGTVLKVNFTSTREWVGLVEIRVYEAVPVAPAVPSAPVPADGNSSVLVSTSLGWNPSVGATSYDVYFWSPPDSKPLVATTTVTANSWTPTGLISSSEAKSYHWQVVANNGYGPAAGAEWTFSTILVAPAQPSSPTPANAAVDLSVTPILTWAGDPLATSYQVFLWPDSGTKPGSPSATVTDPSWNPGILLEGTIYHWQVEAVNTTGSTPGPVWTFTTAVPIPPSPIIGILNGSFEEIGVKYVDWAGVLYEAKDWTNLSSESNAQAASMLGGQENTPAATQGLRVLRLATDVTDVGRAAQYLGTMDAGATYVFAADAFSSNDLPWSGTAAFVNEATATPGTVYATQTLDLGIGTTGVLTVSYTALPADAGNQLFIWLQSNTPSPTRGGIDNARLVGVLPSVPTGPSPADSAGTVSVASSLAWASTPGAIRYELFLWLDGGTKPTEPTAEVLAPAWSPPTALLGLTTYHWQVVAVNVDGSTPGPEWTFTTAGIPPAVPASPSPANGAGIAGVDTTLTWASDPLATSFEVFLWPAGDTKPATATATVTDPTYNPGALLTETAYQWQVVAGNAVTSTPGPVWSFTTSVIPYTYIYEADSVPPNVPAELANPYFLNDGLIGTTWDATTIMYYFAAQSNVQPHVTFTLAPNAGLGKLTVWYTRWDAAGLFVPASLTVSDEFGHSAMTVFTLPAGDQAVFTQDVALGGMQGTVLHLSFATAGEAWLGLNEIRVFEPAPLPPETPSGPAPVDGSIAVPVTTSLVWNNSVGATSYDVYFWNAADPEPSTASATVTTNSWTPASGMISASEATYHWKVVAKNDYGDAAGAVWTFTTSIIPYTYVYEADSVQPAEPELSTPSVLNDGVIGTGWGYLYMTGATLTGMPHITLTLAPNSALEKLTVWYTRGVAAGIFVPASVTVSDEFSHTTTTTFATQEADGVFGEDVPLTGMQGTVLHLNFASTETGSWLGLNEIKVFGTAGSGSGYDTWASVHAGGQTAEMDYDHDGMSNGVEFFMDAPDGFTENPGVVNGKVSWSRVNPVASFGVQVSDNLTDWSPANPSDVDLSDPSQVIYTFPSGAAKKFCRLVVTP